MTARRGVLRRCSDGDAGRNSEQRAQCFAQLVERGPAIVAAAIDEERGRFVDAAPDAAVEVGSPYNQRTAPPSACRSCRFLIRSQ